MKPGHADHDAGPAKTEGGSAPSLALDAGVMGGSTDGFTEADLRRGFKHCGQHEAYGNDMLGAVVPSDPYGSDQQGFLDRPTGWER